MSEKEKNVITGFTGEFFDELIGDTEIGEKVRSCIQCGTCTASCPVAFKSELSPREILRMVLIGESGEILRPEVLYYCSACYSCAVRCPMGIRLTELVNLLRDIMVERGEGPLPPQTEMVKSVDNYDNPWLLPRAQRDRWARKLDTRPKVLPRKKAKMLYYPGCTAAYLPNMQRVALATAEVLERAGVDFGIMGREEVCCGSTAMRVGVRKTFIAQVEKNTARINALGVDSVVTACAGCFGIMKHEYPRVAELQPEVLHISEVIARLVEEGELEPGPITPRVVTYHDPCHLARHGGVVSEPRKVIEAIPGLELVEMARTGLNSRCCGGGGGLRTGHAGMAVGIASLRQREAEETGAELLVTCCPFCEQNLSDAGEQDGGLPVIDLVELVLESMNASV
ncbi:MAG: (Fe-S)-binding protein [Actinobacteria bacterium]|nr:(Fe-S)-binding protein [Actinomycetota bacterium]MCG2819759.1 (Fe-S)-binding protein [Actinomycetes bacterium]MBU4178673.1 (Fe-S)-binding protein [Actinomycetota bacterium]MBU4219263.1 (Fe-S)-binding protein [Actinomycetota bacterium]MBU4359547.1 (Fe-S)-binding protein [Actinomycetota bacterium]